MNVEKIEVVKDFGPRPRGRYYPEDGDLAGERFRDEWLIPALNVAIEKDRVLEVNLEGYNRYGPSFLDEAFGALASIGGFSLEQLDKYLEIKHPDLPSIVESAKSRMTHHAHNKEKIVEKYKERKAQ